MLGRAYHDQTCSIARTLEVVGERWTLLILRDAQLGLRRFDEFQTSLGIASNVLTARLGNLVEAGLLDRVRYQDRPPRYEYRLTEKGRELTVAAIALMRWGDRHLARPKGAPRLARHRGCDGDVAVRMHCTRCGATVQSDALELIPGPGLTGAPAGR